MSSWQEMAISEANKQSCDKDIVLATIEAETGGRNVMGDSDHAYGYGQVWYKWHKEAFDFAAKRLNVSYPQADGPSLKQFILSNNLFSMIVTVKTIKDIWLGQSKNWHDFTLSYVGPKIPTSDYNRRYKIWLKYHDGKDISSTISTTPNTLYSTDNYASVEEPTIYKVDAMSQEYGDILYGRKYRVLISNNGDTALDVSRLRCTFNIVKTVLMQPNYCEVVIYNLNAETENAIIKEGMRILVEAGYEGEQYGGIFDGDLLQPIREKEDGTTFKLTLSSLDGDKFLQFGFSNFSILRGQSMRDMVYDLTQNTEISTGLGSISEDLNTSQLTRGKVVFGLAKNVLRQVAQTNSATFYMEDGKVNIIKATDIQEDRVIELSPTTGLIGTPSQYEYGVIAKCLLNPRIKLNSLIHIDNSLIRARKAENGEVLRSLDDDGLYRVIKITHIGDTRGNDWYTEVETVTQSGILPNMASTAYTNIW